MVDLSSLRKWAATAVGLAALLLTGSGSGPMDRAAARSGEAAPVKRSSSAIAITADGQTLLVVNPDSGSLSVVELDQPPGVTEIGVGRDPRTVAVSDDGRRAYTANRGSDSVSVVDLVTRQVIGEIAVGARPYGLVVSPDGRRLYVAEQGQDRLAIIDTAALKIARTVPLADRPSGLALSGDGHTLYITHLLSRSISVLGLPLPRVYLPLVAQATQAGGPASLQTRRAGSLNTTQAPTISLWPDSNLVQSLVIAPDGERAYVPHTRSNSSNPALTLDTTVAPLVSVIDLVTGQHLGGQQLNLDVLDPPAVGLPFDAAFTPDGKEELWVVNAASNDVTVIDLDSKQRVAHIEVNDNPRGITISPDGQTAYTNNTLAGNVSVIDTAGYTVTAVIPVTSIPLDPMLLTGKRLFHSSDDPRLGKDQWMSCNTCHFDGEHDGRTWLLGFAGPRNTSSLLGMRETLPLRWSGEWDEAADAEFAIRMDSFGTGLVEGEMHCSLDPPDCANQPPHAGVSADLDALAAYINSLEAPLSPGHTKGQPLTEAAQRGETLFNDPALGCAACHPAPLYTDNLSHDVGTSTAGERIGPAFNTPSLRGLYDSAPYFHDGSAATLYEAVTRPGEGNEHETGGRLNEAEIQDLIAFLLALPYR
jgi:YVTN family beta-propeller protein